MCQSKALGGKRCFAHHPGTKASIAYVHLKTGIDKEQIYAIMKELRKEGKNLEAPTPEELEKYFSLEEFKAKYDQSLTDQEKVAILKQLLSARAEAEREGVSGGIFHSWKHAFAKTVEKIKRPFTASLLAGTLLFTASCSAGTVAPTPTDDTKTPIAAECVIDPNEDLIDVIPSEIVEDEYGPYCKVTISPDAKDGYKTLEWADQGQALKDAGFTEEDATKAQDIAYKFIAEQTLDSSRLDNYNQTIGQWFDANSSAIAPDAQQWYVDATAENPNSNLGMIVTDAFPAPLPRDNAPRISGVKVETYGYQLVESGGSPYLNVGVEFSGNYKTTDENAIALIQKFQPEKTVEQIKSENPTLNDEDPNAFIAVVARQNFSYKKDDLAKASLDAPMFSGTSIQYSLFTDSGSITTSDYGS